MDSLSFGPDRSRAAAWGSRSGRGRGLAINVGESERAISTVAGGLALFYGFSKLSLTSIVGLLAGGALVYRGLSGHCNLYKALDMSTACGNGSSAACNGPGPQHTVGEPSLAATGESPPISR